LRVDTHGCRAIVAGASEVGRKLHIPRRIELDHKGIDAAPAGEGGIDHREIGRIGVSGDVCIPTRVLGNRGRLLHAAATPRGPIADYATKRRAGMREQNNGEYAG
jgi:hypothetical protein